MRYWLFKSEPGCFSFDDLKHCPAMTEHWDGVRNFQARNLLRDELDRQVGGVLVAAVEGRDRHLADERIDEAAPRPLDVVEVRADDRAGPPLAFAPEELVHPGVEALRHRHPDLEREAVPAHPGDRRERRALRALPPLVRAVLRRGVRRQRLGVVAGTAEAACRRRQARQRLGCHRREGRQLCRRSLERPRAGRNRDRVCGLRALPGYGGDRRRRGQYRLGRLDGSLRERRSPRVLRRGDHLRPLRPSEGVRAARSRRPSAGAAPAVRRRHRTYGDARGHRSSARRRVPAAQVGQLTTAHPIRLRFRSGKHPRHRRRTAGGQSSASTSSSSSSSSSASRR